MLKSLPAMGASGSGWQTFVRHDVRQVDAYLDGEIGLDDCQVSFQAILIYGPALRN